MLIELITALADFENLPPPDADAQARLVEHGFGPAPKFEAWLAELPETPGPVGYVFLFETYSTFLARPPLYVEDLLVLPEYRKRGIGRALLRHCFQLAHDRGCGRMEWTCLDWNTNAQAVYEDLGAKRMNEWYLYRLVREDLKKLVSSDPQV